MVLLYLSRKMAWVFAIAFFAIAVGMYLQPETTKPIVGAMVSIGDGMAENFLSFIKAVLS